MARERKRHIQLELGAATRTWGGKRKGAGRPPKGRRPGERHRKRERFDKPRVAHVTLRLVAGFETLRRRDAYFALRKATRAVLGRTDFRIVHLSPEDDHVHLLVEAASHAALRSGIQAFEISAAQHLNKAVSRRSGCVRKGQVFADRYHVRFVSTPTQARNALRYVLNNWRHHGHDEGWDERVREWDVDYMSSAVSFTGWKELAERPFMFDIPEEARLCVSPPRSWLLAVGGSAGSAAFGRGGPRCEPGRKRRGRSRRVPRAHPVRNDGYRRFQVIGRAHHGRTFAVGRARYGRTFT